MRLLFFVNKALGRLLFNFGKTHLYHAMVAFINQSFFTLYTKMPYFLSSVIRKLKT